MDKRPIATTVFRFGSFELDTRVLELRCEGHALRVQPRVFDLIRHLVENHGRVISRDELLAHVWGGLKVEESSLYRAIALARRLLGERGGEQPIALVRGRGYRFVADVVEKSSEWTDAVFVGRADLLARLDEALAASLAGSHRVTLLTGEAGIGKTALVECWTDRLRRAGGVRVAFGQCLEVRGAAEPYRPLLDALSHLAEQAPRGELVDVLRRCAPTWLAQLPRLTAPAEGASLQREASRADRGRMLREICDALRELGGSRPLVLILEDLQWSDPSTLDVIEACALARRPMQLLLVVTLRVGEPTGDGLVGQRVAKLRTARQSLDLALPGLSGAEVRELLTRRFGAGEELGDFARWCRQRSSGNPLFLNQLLDTLVDRGRITVRDGRLRLESPLASLDGEIPKGIAELVHRQLEALSENARALVEAAAVVGTRSCSALIAAGVDRDPADPTVIEETERELEALVGEGGLLRYEGVEEWPDGTISASYAFRHALYRDVVYDDLRPSRRVRVHRWIGAALEKAFAEDLASVSSELAGHFDAGRERERALPHFVRAIRLAERRYAREEALGWAERAIALADALPAPLREPAELQIRLALAPALSRAPAHSETDRNWIRAEELCRRVGDNRSLCTVLWGRSYYAYQCQEYPRSLELACELLGRAQPLEDPFFRVLAHDGLARSFHSMCDFENSLEHAEHALAFSDPELREVLIDHVGQDVASSSGITAAFSLWHLGRVGAALARMAETIAQAEVLGHSYTHAFVLSYAALFYYGTRDRELARSTAERAMAVAEKGSHEDERVFSGILRAASLARNADRLGQLRAALATAAATTTAAETRGSSEVGLTILLGEVLAEAGEHDEARSVVAAGLAGVASAGERTFEPSLRFIEAQLDADPIARFEKLEAARQLAAGLGMRMLELEIAQQAAVGLRARGERDRAHGLLAPLLARFAGEPAVPVLREARALLAELA